MEGEIDRSISSNRQRLSACFCSILPGNRKTSSFSRFFFLPQTLLFTCSRKKRLHHLTCSIRAETICKDSHGELEASSLYHLWCNLAWAVRISGLPFVFAWIWFTPAEGCILKMTSQAKEVSCVWQCRAATLSDGSQTAVRLPVILATAATATAAPVRRRHGTGCDRMTGDTTGSGCQAAGIRGNAKAHAPPVFFSSWRNHCSTRFFVFSPKNIDNIPYHPQLAGILFGDIFMILDYTYVYNNVKTAFVAICTSTLHSHSAALNSWG